MIEFHEAISILKNHHLKLTEKEIPLLESLGKYTSQDILAQNNIPSFNNSAMDGYAIKFSEVNCEYEIAEIIQAGFVSEKKFKSNQCARIFTGARVPDFFDTVIPQEMVNKDGHKISFNLNEIKSGGHIRKIGEQHQIGKLLVTKNKKINPSIISLLATDGVEKVKVFDIPKVKLIITGNELIEVGKPLEKGKIYNSNQFLISSYFKEKGLDKIDLSLIEDDAEKIEKELEKAKKSYDLIILTGGISVGDYDFVKMCLDKVGAETLFYKVKQKPGKPFCVAKYKDTYCFAFPGNPSSVLSCLYTYLNSFIEASFGNKEVWNFEEVSLNESYHKKSDLTLILKAYYDGKVAKILDGQESFNLSPFAIANCLVILDSDKNQFEKEEIVKVIWI